MTLQLSHGNRSYGCIANTPDSRDKVLRLAGTITLPPNGDLIASLGPVRDQGQEGSCVGHGWAGHADWLFKQYGVHHLTLNLSPAFIYYLARQIEGTLPDDAGAQVRSGAKVFNQFGVCPEDADLYGPQTMNAAPSDAALSTAMNYKGGAYHTLPTLEDMKSCLASSYCFVDGIQVFESFESDAVASSGEVPLPADSEPSIGGHCTLTFGYDDEHLNIDGSKGALHKRNSWGSAWGQSGDFWLPYAYVEKYLTNATILHLGPAWGA